MHGSPLLPYETFASVLKGTNQGWLLCALKARGLDLFACVLTSLSSVLPAGLLSGPDQDVPFIFWSLALQSHTLTHCHFSAWACRWVSALLSQLFLSQFFGQQEAPLREGERKGPSSQCQPLLVYWVLG